MNKLSLVLSLLIVTSYVLPVRAQVDEAPQEPPYVQEDIDGGFAIDSEVEGTAGNSSAADDDEVLSFEQALQDENSFNEPSVAKPQEEDLKFDDEDVEAVPQYASPEPDVVPAPDQYQEEPAKVYKNSRGRVEYIEHPLAAKGLMAITKDGSYIYRTQDNSAHKHTGAVRLGMMDPPKITAADGTTYEMMYSEGQQPVFFFDYEWKPFQKWGMLGVQASIGALYATGHGRFADPNMGHLTPKEQYTFLAMPLSLGIIYRLEWMKRQWIAPYVSGGGTYVGVVEFRDDGKTPSLVGTPGAYGGAGMMFNISAINRETAFTLRSEYGISNLWVSVDYRYLNTFSEDVDFTSNIIGAGIIVDY